MLFLIVFVLLLASISTANASISISYNSKHTEERCYLVQVNSESSFELYQSGKYSNGEYTTLELDFEIAGVANNNIGNSWSTQYVPSFDDNTGVNVASFMQVSSTEGRVSSTTKSYVLISSSVAYQYVSHFYNDIYITYEFGLKISSGYSVTYATLFNILIHDIRVGYGSTQNPPVSNKSACSSFKFRKTSGTVNDWTANWMTN